jgi:hypothetical protein
MTRKTIAVLVAGAAALVVGAPNASAQEPASAQGGVSAQATATAPPASAPSAPPAAAAAVSVGPAREEEPDHERFVGHFAVGYFGISKLPIALEGAQNGNLARDPNNVNAPVIGVRYWLQRNLGLDLGLGFGWSGGSAEFVANNASTSFDHKSLFGLAFHGGVPLAFAHGKHYSFLVIPEATVGFASGTVKGQGPNPPPDQDLSGFKLDLGGRVGAEIHFGFIGIPELSLEGSVGLFFRRESIKWKQDTASASDGTNTISTSVQSDPWALFVNNISAFYYF